ncbi:MAG TPA: GTPase HflX [Gemmatimonadaceae bacterium]|nr:GTPase HflX [Gemmatimonadaceae bacterium]
MTTPFPAFGHQLQPSATSNQPDQPSASSPISRPLIDLSSPVERALLVGAPLKRTTARHHLDEHLLELDRLADTAGAQVVGTLTQQLDRPNPATYLGKGKTEELRERIGRENVSLVIFDDELSPTQGKNIEDATGCRVVDRAELILDIFATRARSREARMQVELAQLEYMLPRLTRMWSHLEKMRGGIGLRGPGETQLETDRRLIGQRIRVLKERLREVQRAREIQRQSRRGEFRVALVGYTNAGKSSILRGLSGASDVFVEDRLFATLDTLTREVELGDRLRLVLTDTVGFIRKLPHHLVASFRATLEEVGEADLLMHVIDASHPNWEEQVAVVEEVLGELGVGDRPVLHVFNKVDLLAEPDVTAIRRRMAVLRPNSVFVSTMRPEGLEPLRDALRRTVSRQRPVAELRIPVANGRLLAEIHRSGEVLDQRSEGEEMILRARLDSTTLGRLSRAGAVVRAG